jgi:hypothetical protein
MIILIKLFLAHFLGDFLFQPNSWVDAKEDKKLRAYQLYLHIMVHGLIIMIFMWNLAFFKWAVLIMVVHLIIDAFKIMIQNDTNRRNFFFIDQIIHILSIYFIWLIYSGGSFPIDIILNEHIWLFIMMGFILTIPASITIKTFISKWTPDTEKKDIDSLQSAGKYIGILERLFIMLFIIVNHWEAIGFLIAAKSVFRFGDLKEAKDKKLTEYILIGTLVSFAVAIFIGELYIRLR